jgi:hypothetical protein
MLIGQEGEETPYIIPFYSIISVFEKLKSQL